MIKKVFFTAALLVPGLAYGGNPSASLSVQVVPGSEPPPGIPCAVGPNYTGSIPPGAQAAGLTTCVANIDFTSTANFTYNGVTENWSNVATWWACAGASQPIWKLYPGAGTPNNCADVHIITDNGANALAMDLTAADYANGGQNAGVNGTYAITDSHAGWVFPNEVYVEVKQRLDTNTYNNPPQDPNGSGNYTIYASPFWEAVNGSVSWVEWDLAEIWGNANKNTYANIGAPLEWTHDGSCSNNLCYNPSSPQVCAPNNNCDLSIAHIYGMRNTEDSNGNIAYCGYMDNVQNASTCLTAAYHYGASDAAVNQRNWFQLQTGPLSYPNMTVPVTVRVITYFIRIWSCATWQTTNCANGLVTSNP
jgi:hypothetical protein